LGFLSYFLGLEVSFSSDGYYLSQAEDTSDLLSRVKLSDSKIVDSTLKMNSKIEATTSELLLNRLAIFETTCESNTNTTQNYKAWA
jgi:hypothetical protein